MIKTFISDIDGQSYDLQSPSVKGYMDISDKFNAGKIGSYDFTDWILKNSVTSPLEIKSQGAAYFNDKERSIAVIEDIVIAVTEMFR